MFMTNLFSNIVWFPIFVAFSGNGQSVYDAWRNPSMCNEVPAPFKRMGKGRHLRSQVIDYWADTNIKKVSKINRISAAIPIYFCKCFNYTRKVSH